MNILILGSGGREHAFAETIRSSKHCNMLYVGPGNSGTEKIATNLKISPNDFPAVKKQVLQHKINMVLLALKTLWLTEFMTFF